MVMYFEMGYLVDADPLLGKHAFNEIELAVSRALVDGICERADIVGDVD